MDVFPIKQIESEVEISTSKLSKVKTSLVYYRKVAVGELLKLHAPF